MARSKTTEDYTAEAKKLLAWWQESLHNQMRHPDTLNAWFAAMQSAANASSTSQGAQGTTPHASKRRKPTASHESHEHDALVAQLRAELRSLTARVAELERALAKHGLNNAKPVSKTARKPISRAAKAPISKPKPHTKPKRK